jgi:hypothetical protein
VRLPRRLRRHRRVQGRQSRLVTAGFVGGVVAGLVIWSVQMRRCKRDLFSTSPVKRLAALGYLGGQASLDTAHLLTEYVRWEKHSVLRKRAQRLLQRMQGGLV